MDEDGACGWRDFRSINRVKIRRKDIQNCFVLLIFFFLPSCIQLVCVLCKSRVVLLDHARPINEHVDLVLVCEGALLMQ